MRRAACLYMLSTLACGAESPADAERLPLDAAGAELLRDDAAAYRHACDGSGAVALDERHFLNFSDEHQRALVYVRGADAPPVRSADLSRSLGLDPSDEADFEAAARTGDRIYVMASHGRNSDGELQPARRRFLALDSASFEVVGYSARLLDDLLDARNWRVPDADLLERLEAATLLSEATVAALAPEAQGLNIEGLAALPNGELLFGLRNPQPEGRAILVGLVNPGQVLSGAPARFGEAVKLELGGLGIRALAWSSVHRSLLILAGPRATGAPFRLYRWTGDGASPAILVHELDDLPGSPEALVVYPDTPRVQLLLDMGDAPVEDKRCKKAAPERQWFTDVWLDVPVATAAR